MARNGNTEACVPPPTRLEVTFDPIGERTSPFEQAFRAWGTLDSTIRKDPSYPTDQESNRIGADWQKSFD